VSGVGERLYHVIKGDTEEEGVAGVGIPPAAGELAYDTLAVEAHQEN
jgi:hypothetical protein